MSSFTTNTNNLVFNLSTGAAGKWKCTVCLIQNDADRNMCEACEAPKPGYEAPKGPKFLFGASKDPSACPFLKNMGSSMETSAAPPPVFGFGTAPAGGGFKPQFGFGNLTTDIPAAVITSTAATTSSSSEMSSTTETSSPSPVNSPDSDDASDGESPLKPRGFSPSYTSVVEKITFTPDTETYDLYTWGNGECDQMPFDDEELNDVNAIALPRCIPNVSVKQVACGALHSIALLANGRLVSWGCNDDSALGRVGDERSAGVVEGLESISAVSCGDNHSACLTTDGSCFIWGVYKDSGGFIGFPVFTDEQIGGGERQSCRVPTKVEGLPGRCTSLVSGENHTAVLCNGNGSDNKGSSLCVWGDTEFGQLGFPAIEGYGDEVQHEKYLALFPKEHDVGSIAPGAQIVALYSGGACTFIKVTAAGGTAPRSRRRSPGKASPPTPGMYPQYYGCGRNFNGEVGVGIAGVNSVVEGSEVGADAKIEKFQQLEVLRGKEVLQLRGGQFFTAALVSPGEVFTWGMGEFACHGKDFKSKFITEPTRISGLDEIVDDVGEAVELGVGAGTGFITTRKGLLFSWGEGISLQLGTGHEEFDPVVRLQSVNPQSFNNRPVKMAFGGSQHSMALVCRPKPSEPVLKRRRVGATPSAEISPATSPVKETVRAPAKKRGGTSPEDQKGRKRIRHTPIAASDAEQTMSDKAETSPESSQMFVPPAETRTKRPQAKAKNKTRSKSAVAVEDEGARASSKVPASKTLKPTKTASAASTETVQQEPVEAAPKARSRGRPKSVVEKPATESSSGRKRGTSKAPVSELPLEIPKIKARRVGRSPAPSKEPKKIAVTAAQNTSLQRRTSVSPMAPRPTRKQKSPETEAEASASPESVATEKTVKRPARKAAAKKSPTTGGGKTPASENMPKPKPTKKSKTEKPAKVVAEKPLSRAQRLEARKANAV